MRFFLVRSILSLCPLGLLAGCNNRPEDQSILWAVHRDELPLTFSSGLKFWNTDKNMALVVVEIRQPVKQLQIGSWDRANVKLDDFRLRGTSEHACLSLVERNYAGEKEPHFARLVFITTVADATAAQMDLLFRGNRTIQLNKDSLTDNRSANGELHK